MSVIIQTTRRLQTLCQIGHSTIYTCAVSLHKLLPCLQVSITATSMLLCVGITCLDDSDVFVSLPFHTQFAMEFLMNTLLEDAP